MASLYPKKIGGKTYWYLREMARVDGKPKMVSERYLGTAAEIAAAMEGREAAALPERTRHLAFGDVAAAWGMLEELGVAADHRRGGRAAPGRAAAVHRDLPGAGGAEPAGRPVLEGRVRGLVEDHRGGPVHQDPRLARWTTAGSGTRCTPSPWSSWSRISRQIAARVVRVSGVDVSSVALDMTNFATFIATANGRAPIAQRGKAKQKRSDLRLVGLGLVVTRDGGIPLTWHAYPGDRPDVTQFPDMIDQLRGRYEAVCAAAGADAEAADMTVVFDAGQNSEANFAHLARRGLHYIGSVPASDCPDLTALPASRRAVVDKDRFGGLTAYDTRREVYGAERRAILTHSPELHDSQARGFDGTTLAKAGKKLDELAATLARGKTRRARDKVEAEIEQITRKPWVRRVITWQLAGDQPKDLRLTWRIDPDARAALEEEIFGKHVLITEPRRLARRRGHRRVPVPVRGRVLLPAAERPARRVVLPDAPLDRAQHPRPRLHLRPGPPDRPPHAPPRPPGRTGPVRPRTARPARRHRRDRPDLPLHRRPAQSPPHDHRAHRRPATASRDLRPGTLGAPKLGHTPKTASARR